MEEGVALNESEAAIPPLVERAVEGVVLTLICILATGGNVVLWAVVRRSPDLHSSSNYLLLCLSAADLLVAVVNMPLTVYTIFVGRWVLTQGMCVATGFSNMFSFTASVMSLCMITANRYIRVCRPHLYPRLYSPRASLIHIAGVWCLSGLLSLPPLVGWGEYGYEAKHYFCFCTWQQSLSYSVFMVAFCFGGTSSLMGGCYVAIYRTFTRSKRQLAVNTATVTHTDNTAIRDRLNSFGDPRAGRDSGSVFGSLRSIRDRLSSFGEQRGARAECFGSVSSVRERLGSYGEPRSCSVERGSFGSLERIGECGSYGEPGPFREKASSYGNMNSFRDRVNSDENKTFGVKANSLADSHRFHSLGSSKNVRYRLDSGGEGRRTEDGDQLEPLSTSTRPERVCGSGDGARGSGGEAGDTHSVADCRSSQHYQLQPAPHGVPPPAHSHSTPGGAAPTLRHAFTRCFSFRTRRTGGGQGCNETSASMKRLRSKLRSMDRTGSKATRGPVCTRESRHSPGHGDRARSGEGHGDMARSDKSQETSPEEELLSADSCTPLTVVSNHVKHYNDCREKTVEKGKENDSRGTTWTEGGPRSASRPTETNQSESHVSQRTRCTGDGSWPGSERSEGRPCHNTRHEAQRQSHSSAPQSPATSPEPNISIHSTKFSRAAHILRFLFNNLPGKLDVSQPLHVTLSGESDVPYPHTDGVVLRSVTKTRCDLDPARTGQTSSETKLGHVATDLGHQDESFTDLRLTLPVVSANHCRGQGQNSADRLPRSHSAGHCGHRHLDQSVTGTHRNHDHSVTGTHRNHDHSVTGTHRNHDHSVTGTHRNHDQSVTGTHRNHDQSVTGTHRNHDQSVTGTHRNLDQSVTGTHRNHDQSVTGTHRNHDHSVTGTHRNHDQSVTGTHRNHDQSVTGTHRNHDHSVTGTHRNHDQSVTGTHRNHDHSVRGTHRNHDHSVTGTHRNHDHSVTGTHRNHDHSVTGTHRNHDQSVTGTHRNHDQSVTGTHRNHDQSVTGTHRNLDQSVTGTHRNHDQSVTGTHRNHDQSVTGTHRNHDQSVTGTHRNHDQSVTGTHRNHDQSVTGTHRSHHRQVHNDISCLPESLSANHSKSEDDISCLSEPLGANHSKSQDDISCLLESLGANHSKSQDDISCLPEPLGANHSKSQDDISCLPESLGANHSKSQDDISCLSQSPNATQDKSQTSAPRSAGARRDTDSRRRHSDVDGAARHSVSPATMLRDNSDDVDDRRDSSDDVDDRRDNSDDVDDRRDSSDDVDDRRDNSDDVDDRRDNSDDVDDRRDNSDDVDDRRDSSDDVDDRRDSSDDVDDRRDGETQPLLHEDGKVGRCAACRHKHSVVFVTDTSSILTATHDVSSSSTASHDVSSILTATHDVSSILTATHDVSSILTATHDVSSIHTATHDVSSILTATHDVSSPCTAPRVSFYLSDPPNSRDRKDVSASVPCSTCYTLTGSQRSNESTVPARPPGNTSCVTSRPRSNTYTSSHTPCSKTNTTCDARTLNIVSASKHASLTVPQVPSVTSIPRVDTTTSPSSGRSNVTPVALAGETTQSPPRVITSSFSLKPPSVTATPSLSSKLSPPPSHCSQGSLQVTSHCSQGSLQVTSSRNLSSLTRAKNSNPTAAQRVGMTSCPQTLALPNVSCNHTSSATCLTSPTSSALQRVGTSTSLFMAPRVNTSTSLLMPRVNTNASFFMPRVNTNTSLASSRNRRQREEMRLTSTMLLVILVYVISWLPYCVMILVNIFTLDGVPRRLDMLALLMGYSNSLYNPLIYGWRNVNIRRGYLKLWKDMRAALLSVSCKHQRRSRPAKVVFEV